MASRTSKTKFSFDALKRASESVEEGMTEAWNSSEIVGHSGMLSTVPSPLPGLVLRSAYRWLAPPAIIPANLRFCLSFPNSDLGTHLLRQLRCPSRRNRISPHCDKINRRRFSHQLSAINHQPLASCRISSNETPSTFFATASSTDSDPLRWIVRCTCDKLSPGASAAAGDDDSNS